MNSALRNPTDAKIAILTGASLAWNPRVLKEAATLAHAGFGVVVYGSNWDQARFESDQALALRHGFLFEPTISTSSIRVFNKLRLFWCRLICRAGRELFKRMRIENRWQIGPLVGGLLRRARASNADYFIVHLEQAIWVGCRLLDEGKYVGIDFEDWFSEDLLPDSVRQRPIRLLRNLERRLLKGGAHATCPSRAMSKVLGLTYGSLQPAVIYNAFKWTDRLSLDGAYLDRRSRSTPSIHWFSQTLGPGRGLEDLLASLPYVEGRAEIHLRGARLLGFDEWLSRRVPKAWRRYIFVHDTVSSDSLLSRISEHDIGFAGEMKYCRNKDLTISNKILHYLLAGLAVVASDTNGQKEVAEHAPDAVFLYPSGDALALASRLNSLLDSKDDLLKAKSAALQAAKQLFCWEHQEHVLLETIMRAIFKTDSLVMPNDQIS